MSEASADFLFARASFWEGAARVLDLGATLTEFNYSVTPEQADAIAVAADFRAVAYDLRQATQAVANDLEREQLSLPL